MELEEIEVIRVGPRAPNLNPHIERFFLSLQTECLAHFLILGEDHLRHLASCYLDWYLRFRPHQGLGNELIDAPPTPAHAAGDIACEEKLGGLLKHYYRKAA